MDTGPAVLGTRTCGAEGATWPGMAKRGPRGKKVRKAVPPRID